jgi:hypothetical protein
MAEHYTARRAFVAKDIAAGLRAARLGRALALPQRAGGGAGAPDQFLRFRDKLVGQQHVLPRLKHGLPQTLEELPVIRGAGHPSQVLGIAFSVASALLQQSRLPPVFLDVSAQFVESAGDFEILRAQRREVLDKLFGLLPQARASRGIIVGEAVVMPNWHALNVTSRALLLARS